MVQQVGTPPPQQCMDTHKEATHTLLCTDRWERILRLCK
jgi:hypothetical protein